MENFARTVNAESYRRHFGSEGEVPGLVAPTNSGNAVPEQEPCFRIIYSHFDALRDWGQFTTSGFSRDLFEMVEALQLYQIDLTNLTTRSLPDWLHIPTEDFEGADTTDLSLLDDAIERSGVPDKVYELRRLTGLSWEQLSSLLGVSRRTLHNWTIGKEIARKNEERLARALSVVRRLDRGSAAENRSLLLSPAPDGGALVDLLGQERYKDLEKIVGRGVGRVERRARPLDKSARRQIMPERFGEALDRAMADPIGEPPENDEIASAPRNPRKIRRITRLRPK